MPLLTKLTRLEIEDVIKNHYDLGSVKSVFKIKTGWNNTLFKVGTTHGEFLLKVYEDIPLEQVYAEHEVVNFLVLRKFLTAPIIKNINYEGVTHFNDKVLTLFSYIHAKPLVDNPFKTVLGTRIAGITSLLHQTPTKDFMYVKKENLAELIEECSSWYLTDHRLTTFRTDINNLYNIFESYNFSDLSIGVIHNDLGTDNFLVVDNNLKALIDFDQVAIGSFSKDLAKLFARSVNLANYDTDELSLNMSNFISDYMVSNKLQLIDINLFMPLFVFQKVLIYIKVKKHLREDTVQAELYHFEEYIKNLEQELELVFKNYNRLEVGFLKGLNI